MFLAPLAAKVGGWIGGALSSGAAHKVGSVFKEAAPALASTVGGTIANKIVGGPSGQQKDANAALQQLALTTGNKGLSFLDQAQNNLTGPSNYFQSILSGNRGAASSALAPEIAQIGSSFNAAKQSSTDLTPRSGGRSTLFNELPFEKLKAVNNLFSTARRDAAKSATDLGLGMGGLGASAAVGGQGGIQNLLTQLAQQRATQYQSGKDMGSSIYNIAKSIPWGDIFGKKTPELQL